MTESVASITSQATDQVEEEPPDPLSRQSEVEEVDEEPPGTALAVRSAPVFANVPQEQWDDWKWHFRNRITTIDQLTPYIPLSAKEQRRLRLVASKYPLSVTPFYLSLINPADPDDPVRKQAVPRFEEVALAGMGVEDPLGEEGDSVVPGLVHRYPDRVLMVLTDLCAMLCRHCTRKREWRHGGWVRSLAETEAMLDYVRNHREIRDVVLSGGDPLTLSTPRLEKVISELRRMKHVDIIRIGTRFPVVLPQRIDDELCNMLSRYGPIWLNTQFNHVREITPEAARACDRLLRAGVPVNNQTVLLRGINDTVEAQTRLCQGLLKIKVRPYYLFECDEVQGTEHLRTPVGAGLRIIQGMRGHTSGLAVPTFVIDLPNGGGKVPLQPDYVVSHRDDELILRNYEGRLFHYRNPRDPKLGPAKANRSNGNGRNGGKSQMAFPDLVTLS